MKRLVLCLILILCCPWMAQGSPVSWSVGVRIGAPPIVVGPRPYPYYHYQPYPYGGYYVRPAPIYYEQPQVIVRPAPVIYQEQAPVVVSTPAPSTISHSVVPAVPVSTSAAIEGQLQLLSNPDEAVRADAALDLGRMKSERAIDPL